MKHFRPRTLIALFPALLIVLCFLVNCIGEQWFDDGEKYLCPECKYRQFYDYGFICERCGASIPYSPVIYCYDCAKELNCCQRCGIERWWCLLKCQNVKHRPSDTMGLRIGAHDYSTVLSSLRRRKGSALDTGQILQKKQLGDKKHRLCKWGMESHGDLN